MLTAHRRTLSRLRGPDRVTSRWSRNPTQSSIVRPAGARPENLKILVTVGTELPFDRLVKAVDAWSVARARSDEVFAQVGRSTCPPPHVRWARFLDGPQFQEYFRQADIIVSHAGMGTVLSALTFARPIIVMPRRQALGEHRSDHQLATANRLMAQGRVEVALDEDALIEHLDAPRRIPRNPIGPFADPSLLAAISEVIDPAPFATGTAGGHCVASSPHELK